MAARPPKKVKKPKRNDNQRVGAGPHSQLLVKFRFIWGFTKSPMLSMLDELQKAQPPKASQAVKFSRRIGGRVRASGADCQPQSARYTLPQMGGETSHYIPLAMTRPDGRGASHGAAHALPWPYRGSDPIAGKKIIKLHRGGPKVAERHRATAPGCTGP